MNSLRSSLLIAAFIFCFVTETDLVQRADADLIINVTQLAGSAPTTSSGTGSLSSVMNAAADVWELAFNDSSFSHTLNINYYWFGFSGGTLAAHSLTSQSGTPNRETGATIRFDNDSSAPYFLDASLDPGDPINNGNSEYGTYTETSQDFGGGLLNKGRVFTAASGDAVGRWDLFSVALHEIGHALGLSSLNTSYQLESWPDNDVDVTFGPFTGSVIPTTNSATPATSSSSNAHLNINTALMFPSIGSGIRRLPSAADILANAQISQFFNPNLNLSSVPEPSSFLIAGVLFSIGLMPRRRK